MWLRLVFLCCLIVRDGLTKFCYEAFGWVSVLRAFQGWLDFIICGPGRVFFVAFQGWFDVTLFSDFWVFSVLLAYQVV